MNVYQSHKKGDKKSTRDKNNLATSMLNSFGSENIESLTSSISKKVLKGMYAHKNVQKSNSTKNKNKENQIHMTYKSLNKRATDQSSSNSNSNRSRLGQPITKNPVLKTKGISHKTYMTRQNSPKRVP
jgi:hypothetical protein